MASNIFTPRVIKSPQNVQLSFELPHRIHTAKIYPLQSSNGSTVILYGHENGVKIVWRGGRPFKSKQPTPAPSQKANGGGAIISLDSDDEGDSSRTFDDKPEFEDEEEELNPLRPYPSTLQVLDLCFNTDVLHLAVLPSSVLRADGPSWRGLESLKQRLVFTAACADNTVRLVTLPLTPPSPASKARSELRNDFTSASAGKGKWGETVTFLSGHQKPSDGISMTADPVGGPGTLVKSASPQSSTEPHLVVASHSREVTGLLRLYQIPIKSQQSHIEPFQSIYLSAPAKAISFNPALSGEYSSRLLVADSVGACRIYDYKLLIKTAEEASEIPLAEQGTWLLSLYTGFPKSDSQTSHTGAHAGFGRKSIVDAQWVSGGKAILVLMADGEWAIWDVEGSGPNASQGILGRQGVKGGSKSGYSLTGYLDGAMKSRSSGPPQMSTSKFAPMTPGTRKTAEPFSGRSSDVSICGQISVMDMPVSSPTSPPEESILFWFGETYAVIPSLAKYWSAHKNGGSGNLFTGPSGARMIKIENIDLQGERCSGVEQIPRNAPSSSLATDILVLAEHRFTILTTGKQSKPSTVPKPETRLVLAEKATNGGELDVIGIEQALTRMENSASRRKLF
ncbi:uncharacterized protein LY89DRAFT_626259 [Mollisia scopiformis]|uniref:Nucleoporin NUP37 n=1 Tax=Mollisia scopiformis TaxID=149040 RepID=A0A194WRW2_MOLSC|nr:uncharacterized protein LY89DRAFT_626259 [Mollisia scopiformis]KUJ10721.1 hypothetical protein LY89DRAFT_626259 [Mollisia scopiformis]